MCLIVMSGLLLVERIDLSSACITPPPAPIDCVWSIWEWLPCSASCGEGQEIGSRIILQTSMHGGAPCTGTHLVVRECNTMTCGGKNEEYSLNQILWLPWDKAKIAVI